MRITHITLNYRQKTSLSLPSKELSNLCNHFYCKPAPTLENSDYEKARKLVKEKKSIYKEAVSWASVCIMLLLINIITSPGFFWCIFPIGFGSFGLAIKFLKLKSRTYFDDWEEKEIEIELDRIQRRKKLRPVDLPEDNLDLEEIPRKVKKWDDRDFV